MAEETVLIKTCKDCGLGEPDVEFYEYATPRKKQRCKVCESAEVLARYHVGKDGSPQPKRVYDKAKSQAQSRKWREANPDRHRDNHLRWRHGITTLELAQRIVDQGGVCKVCSGPITLEGKHGFAIDHDHDCCPSSRSCGKCIRGVLCPPCNIGMGNLRDDPARLRAAADYLDAWKMSRHA